MQHRRGYNASSSSSGVSSEHAMLNNEGSNTTTATGTSTTSSLTLGASLPLPSSKDYYHHHHHHHHHLENASAAAMTNGVLSGSGGGGAVLVGGASSSSITNATATGIGGGGSTSAPKRRVRKTAFRAHQQRQFYKNGLPSSWLTLVILATSCVAAFVILVAGLYMIVVNLFDGATSFSSSSSSFSDPFNMKALRMNLPGGGSVFNNNNNNNNNNAKNNHAPSMFNGRKTVRLEAQDFETGKFDPDMILPYNDKYRIPDSMPIVGDRSDRYVLFRQQIDPLFPEDPQRSLQRVRQLQTHAHGFYAPMPMTADAPHHSDQVATLPYDIYDCPQTPPTGYPFAWNLVQILVDWPPDDATPHPNLYQGLCVFDYTKDYEKAMNYRQAELPFVVINDPQVHQAVERWNTPGYMESMLSDGPHRCEYSPNNHFMYFVPPPKSASRRNAAQVPADWKPPTQLTRMQYTEWLKHANVTDDQLGPDKPHWYYRLIGCGLMGNTGNCDRGSSEYLYDELPFFQPKASLYIVEPNEQKGIHCRFGMKGVIAENHFDGSRNAIVVLGGSRRYILAHPNQCDKLALFPKGHPSARHSAVDWSNPNLQEFPQFAQAMANEVVLQAGHVLYLPTNWFHYIVSLELK